MTKRISIITPTTLRIYDSQQCVIMFDDGTLGVMSSPMRLDYEFDDKHHDAVEKYFTNNLDKIKPLTLDEAYDIIRSMSFSLKHERQRYFDVLRTVIRVSETEINKYFRYLESGEFDEIVKTKDGQS